jgi:hypothetical protein
MTSGLGDYIIMGDLVRKIEALLPDVRCLLIHRNSSHTNLWKYDPVDERFFNVYKPLEVFKFILILKKFKKRGYTIFGLQMVPGSIQGFLLYKMLKLVNVVDFIVDFNLINADIITPPRGEYILDMHLNQLSDIFKIDIPPDFYNLRLPIIIDRLDQQPKKEEVKTTCKRRIGIHPWSRRGHVESFVWPFENWRNLFENLLRTKQNEIIVFGKDPAFNKFKDYIQRSLKSQMLSFKFLYSKNVEELINTISNLDLLISVNTSVVHIGYALRKKMIILCGPSLKYWTPKNDKIDIVKDNKADLPGSDKWVDDSRFPTISRIDVDDVLNTKIVKDFLL